MPAGSGGAGCGAKGFAGAAGVADGAGDGEDVCASVLIENQQQKTSEANSTRQAMLCTRFIISPPKILPATWLAHKVCGCAV